MSCDQTVFSTTAGSYICILLVYSTCKYVISNGLNNKQLRKYLYCNNIMHEDAVTITTVQCNFVGKNFVFWLAKNLWGINFRGHGGVVGTIVVEFVRH